MTFLAQTVHFGTPGVVDVKLAKVDGKAAQSLEVRGRHEPRASLGHVPLSGGAAREMLRSTRQIREWTGDGDGQAVELHVDENGVARGRRAHPRELAVALGVARQVVDAA